MRTLFQFVTPSYKCTYLPQQAAQLEYEIVSSITPAEYQNRLLLGWRRFGFSLFHPQCQNCHACQSLRIPVEQFQPSRSQRRALKANLDLRIVIGEPEVTPEKLKLYDQFHTYQAEHVGWNFPQPKDVKSYVESFVNNPFATQEWCYYLDEQLVGVGYVDVLPQAMSAIYFYHDPQLSKRSLGTFNVLSILSAAQQRSFQYLYMGYYVADCRSLVYKGKFRPNQIMNVNGEWIDFLE